MSAPGDQRRTDRSLLPASGRTRLAGIPFVLLLMVILGLGMTAVLVLNTSIQQQESSLEDLRASAQAAGYRQDLLQGQVDQLGTTDVLAAKAANLGMVPNPAPVIVQMPSGQIHGTPQAAVGTEIPGVAVPSAVPSPTSDISIVASADATTPTSPSATASPSVTATPSAPATPAASAAPSAQTSQATETPTGGH